MKLFEPLQIGSLKLKNRIVLAPMATHYADENGGVTPRLKDYYAEIARGGTGFVITESGYIHPGGRGGQRRMGLHQDSLVPGLKELVDLVHAEGALISSELHHAGRQVNVALHGLYPVSCSSIPSGLEQVVPRTMKIPEIEEMVETFGRAAKRSLAAGFDAILLHGAHGYLIHQFLSPLTNRRTDRYGGTFGRRLRFLEEIILHCREVLGKGYPIMVRLSVHEFIPGGLTLKDSQKIAQHLEEWGVDAIHVSAGTHDSPEMAIQPMSLPRGCLVPLAEGIKKAVSIPVAVVGRIVDPQMAEEILQKGKADLVTLGRALIADPEFPKKVQEGRVEEIRPCIGCLQGCLTRLYQGQPITCLVNASAGLEKESRPKPAAKRKKVLIIGGGPGGMEAARVAASRGHEVSLWEKNDRLGGQFDLASCPPHKKEIKGFLGYLERQLKKLGVKIYLREEMTPNQLAQAEADVIILASGAIPCKPEIPGVDQKNVLSAWEALAQPEKVGRNVLILGGGAVGAEVAEFLIDLRKDVTLIEMAKEIAIDAERNHRKLLLLRLGEKGVKIHVLTEAKAILTEGVEVEFQGRKEIIPADTIVTAMGVKSNRELEIVLKKLPVEVYQIGDCLEPRKALDAIHEGFKIALQI